MVLKVQNIKKSFNKNTVIDVENLEAHEGEFIGLIGNNGAGKTTFFRLALDLLEPDEGVAKIFGHQVNKSEDWKKDTSAYLDEGFLLDYLKPMEYFEFVGKRYGLEKSEIHRRLEYFEPIFHGEILGQKKKLIRDLSKGNQKKVGIAGALLAKPKLVLLDEPFANLDPTTQIKLKQLLKEYKGHTSMIVSSHDLNHVTEVCERTVIMEKGKITRDFETTESTLKELESYFDREEDEVKILKDEV